VPAVILAIHGHSQLLALFLNFHNGTNVAVKVEGVPRVCCTHYPRAHAKWQILLVNHTKLIVRVDGRRPRQVPIVEIPRIHHFRGVFVLVLVLCRVAQMRIKVVINLLGLAPGGHQVGHILGLVPRGYLLHHQIVEKIQAGPVPGPQQVQVSDEIFLSLPQIFRQLVDGKVL
ncbi:unnamed protein product, partial [Plutella xylostella]